MYIRNEYHICITYLIESIYHGSLIPKLDKDYARPGAGHRSQGNTSLPILVVGSGQVETDQNSN